MSGEVDWDFLGWVEIFLLIVFGFGMPALYSVLDDWFGRKR
jgi:hypothetical protein